MPDQYGNLTPAEIAQQSVSASLLVNQLKQQAVEQSQRAQLVDQQIKDSELNRQISHLELDFKTAKKEFLDHVLKGGPLTPQARAIGQILGYDTSVRPLDQLNPDQLNPAGAVAAGLALTAPEAAANEISKGQLDVARGQLGVARDTLALNKSELNSRIFSDAVNAGAEPFLLQGDLTDPKVLANAFKGVTPTARILAAASLITARANALEAAGRSALLKAQAEAQSADTLSAKDSAMVRAKTLQTLVSGLNAANVAVSQAANAGADQTQPLATVSRLAFALDQELRHQNYTLPPEAAPERGFWGSLYDSIFKPKSQSGAGGIDINKLVNPDGSINTAALDQQVPSPTGAATPSAPAPTPTPAPGAAPSSLPLSLGGIPTNVMQSVQDLAGAANAAGLKFNLTFAPPGGGAAAPSPAAPVATPPPAAPTPTLPLIGAHPTAPISGLPPAAAGGFFPPQRDVSTPEQRKLHSLVPVFVDNNYRPDVANFLKRAIPPDELYRILLPYITNKKQGVPKFPEDFQPYVKKFVGG